MPLINAKSNSGEFRSRIWKSYCNWNFTVTPTFFPLNSGISKIGNKSATLFISSTKMSGLFWGECCITTSLLLAVTTTSSRKKSTVEALSEAMMIFPLLSNFTKSWATPSLLTSCAATGYLIPPEYKSPPGFRFLHQLNLWFQAGIFRSVFHLEFQTVPLILSINFKFFLDQWKYINAQIWFVKNNIGAHFKNIHQFKFFSNFTDCSISLIK